MAAKLVPMHICVHPKTTNNHSEAFNNQLNNYYNFLVTSLYNIVGFYYTNAL